MKTRKYQNDAIQKLREAHKNGSALVVMAPGLGKTVVSAIDAQYFLKEEPNARLLYLCHTNEVLEQAQKTFEKVFGNEKECGIFNGIAKDDQADFLFASFQTMKLHQNNFKPDEFSYIIVDEAHHAPATTFKAVVRYFKPKFLLGLTATPNRLDGLSLNKIFGETVYSMDLVDSIVNGYVANVDYRLMLDEMTDIESVAVNGEKLSVSELNLHLFIPKRDEEIARLIQEKISERENPRTMIFCRSIEHAEIIANLIDGAEVVHSHIEEKERQKRIARFRKGKTATVVSIDQLNEGIDIPRADVIVFLRSTVSPVVFYQQLGRGLRLHGKKTGVLILDFVANYERLEIINGLSQEIEARQRISRKRQDGGEHFKLNVDTPRFKEGLVDIIRRISEIRRQQYTKQELIQKLQKKAEELGRTPVKKEVNADPEMPDSSSYERAFGSWNKSVIAAGLKVIHQRTYSRDFLIKTLRERAEELGRTPTCLDVMYPNSLTYANAFGTWNKALMAAGLRPKRIRHYSDRTLINALQKKAKKLKRRPSRREMDKDPMVASSKAYAKHFGSWVGALKAAGLM